ncbi:hypothetical protein SLE2022_391890 [Rubroshorea leprosula]
MVAESGEATLVFVRICGYPSYHIKYRKENPTKVSAPLGKTIKRFVELDEIWGFSPHAASIQINSNGKNEGKHAFLPILKSKNCSAVRNMKEIPCKPLL